MTIHTDEDMYRALGRIEEKLDSLSGLHERVDKIESKQSWMQGIGAGVAFILTLLTFPFDHLFGKH